MKTKTFTRITFLFFIGGIGYYLMEVAFRGYSHWTMGLCGGICLVGIYFINKKFSHLYAPIRAVMCAGLITAVEFLAGCILNLWLGLGIWDYSSLKFHLLGQVSLLFSCIWFAISLVICIVFSKIKQKKMPV